MIAIKILLFLLRNPVSEDDFEKSMTPPHYPLLASNINS